MISIPNALGDVCYYAPTITSSRHQCRKMTVISCHSGVKNEQHLHIYYYFDHQMSLSKSKFKQLFTCFKACFFHCTPQLLGSMQSAAQLQANALKLCMLPMLLVEFTNASCFQYYRLLHSTSPKSIFYETIKFARAVICLD
jgi:hypothetical protein